MNRKKEKKREREKGERGKGKKGCGEGGDMVSRLLDGHAICHVTWVRLTTMAYENKSESKEGSANDIFTTYLSIVSYDDGRYL